MRRFTLLIFENMLYPSPYMAVYFFIIVIPHVIYSIFIEEIPFIVGIMATIGMICLALALKFYVLFAMSFKMMPSHEVIYRYIIYDPHNISNRWKLILICFSLMFLSLPLLIPYLLIISELERI